MDATKIQPYVAEITLQKTLELKFGDGWEKVYRKLKADEQTFTSILQAMHRFNSGTINDYLESLKSMHMDLELWKFMTPYRLALFRTFLSRTSIKKVPKPFRKYSNGIIIRKRKSLYLTKLLVTDMMLSYEQQGVSSANRSLGDGANLA